METLQSCTEPSICDMTNESCLCTEAQIIQDVIWFTVAIMCQEQGGYSVPSVHFLDLSLNLPNIDVVELDCCGSSALAGVCCSVAVSYQYLCVCLLVCVSVYMYIYTYVYIHIYIYI